MPFTFCHPAAVLPLSRAAPGISSLPALVVGSMMPDFVYFFPLGVSGGFSHSLPGIVAFSVPAGMLVLLLYYALLRKPLLAFAPEAIAARMPFDLPWVPRSPRMLLAVILSLALGAATHLGWDAFTHANTAVVHRFDLLRAPVRIGGAALPVFKWLQHFSSLFGFVVILVYTTAWLRRTEPAVPVACRLSTGQRLFALAAMLAAAATGGAAGALLRRSASFERMLFNGVVTGIAAASATVILLCLGWHLWQFQTRPVVGTGR